ncbi:platelet endothelial cell adhesion molecule-like [Discoglossus pictus]
MFSTPIIEVCPSLNFTEGILMSVKCSIQIASTVQEPVEITILKDKTILQSSKTGSAMYFQLATMNQTGNYTCKAETKKTTKNNNAYIFVEELFSRPLLRSNDNTSSINEGDPISLSCSVPGLPHDVSNNLSYYLQKNEGPREPMNKGGKYNKTAMEIDSGHYVCEVTISNITKRSNKMDIKVHALFARPCLQSNINDSDINEGDTLSLSCSVPGLTYNVINNLRYLLRKSEGLGRIINKGGRYNKKVTERDSGFYVCEVTISNITKRSNKIHIKVNELFSMPTFEVFPSDNLTEGSNINCGNHNSERQDNPEELHKGGCCIFCIG